MNAFRGFAVLVMAVAVTFSLVIGWVGTFAILLALLIAKRRWPDTSMLDYFLPGRRWVPALAWCIGAGMQVAAVAAVGGEIGWAVIGVGVALVAADALVMIFRGRLLAQIFGGDEDGADTSEATP